ncbi:WD40 repeat domain-containing protein [Novipirellula artificiosorum]|uniref:WD domain, G-beta repeat n=1 Tax=Novipirellula artificiosorum TaxID=2528016 RepID=A0A5C6CLY3_9BACT|nr:hypothetical protein [Novipirellula artificiosorum]TWU24464.1 WD domain, G-beta repeat [Novipirellula artificiosorum]
MHRRHFLSGAGCLGLVASAGLQAFPQDEAAVRPRMPTTDPNFESVIRVGSAIHGLAVSADGTRFAAVTESGVLMVWDFETQEIQLEFPLSDAPLHTLVFHPDGDLIAAAGGEKSIFVWSLRNHSPLELQGCKSGTASLAFLPNGLVAGGNDGTLRFWDSKGAGPFLAQQRHRGPVENLTVGIFPGTRYMPQGGAVVVSLSEDGMLRFWHDGKFLFQRLHRQKKFAFATFLDGSKPRLCGITDDGEQVVWLHMALQDYSKKIRKVEYKKTLKPRKPGDYSAPRFQIEKESHCLNVYDYTNPVVIATTQRDGLYRVGDPLSLSPNGISLASHVGRAIEIWNLAGQQAERVGLVPSEPDSVVTSIAWGSDSKQLLIGSDAGKIRLTRL